MKKAIAMKCSQKDWDSIKGKLEGITNQMHFNFKENPILTNNWEGIGIICNTYKKHSRVSKCEYHETFNAKIFLNACGIDCDVYEITREQVLKLYNNEGSCYAKEWFPEVFKKELEVKENNFYSIKWNDGGSDLFYCYENNNGVIKHKDMYFRNGQKLEVNHDSYLRLSDLSKDKRRTILEATPQEVEAALICEAENRGYIKGILVSTDNIQEKLKGSLELLNNKNNLGSYKTVLWFGNELEGIDIFRDGIWSEIIETITIQEAEKLLNKKIV